MDIDRQNTGFESERHEMHCHASRNKSFQAAALSGYFVSRMPQTMNLRSHKCTDLQSLVHCLDYIGTLIMHACKSCKSVLSWVPAWNAQRPVTKLLAKCTHRMDTVLFSTYLVCQLAFYKCESQQSAILYIEKIDPSNKWSIQQLSRKPHWEKLPGLILL